MNLTADELFEYIENSYDANELDNTWVRTLASKLTNLATRRAQPTHTAKATARLAPPAPKVSALIRARRGTPAEAAPTHLETNGVPNAPKVSDIVKRLRAKGKK